MNQSLVEFLNYINPSDEAIEIATRSFLSEFTYDMHPEEMTKQMLNTIENQAKLDAQILMIKNQPNSRRDLCLAFSLWAWESELNRERIKASFEGTKGKLPLIDTGILSLVAMYMMYVIAKSRRDKPQRIEETICRLPDGTFFTKKVEEYGSPDSPIPAMEKLFEGVAKQGNLLEPPE